MFADDIRRALQGTPRERLAELSAAVWKGFACGALQEGEAQQLAEEIAARKVVPPRPAEPRRRVGSRPKSPAEMERRRRWTSSGWLPPQLAARFTMAEAAVLSTIAAEVARRGLCRLTIGHIASLAGVGRSTVKNAVRQAAALGILTSEEWRITAWRSAPNTVRIISSEWRAWLRMRDRKRAGDGPRQAEEGIIRTLSKIETVGPQIDRATIRGGGVRTATTLRITDSSASRNGAETSTAARIRGMGNREVLSCHVRKGREENLQGDDIRNAGGRRHP